ncbi:transcriptional regulator [Duganella sp. Leaf126]|uniref:sensor domain-containing diguanylate cyclase n=1 Tax=Duganella sp. Leaf126 TaxID=1736266 RepID=UPI0006FE6237|nr:sensor domain-containing diguanylate cyclase [Duganella sp. Leaf126]KQQ33697.1 transcriptional regulator [Duganella sp. Leaf126]
MQAAEHVTPPVAARPMTDNFRLAALHRYHILDSPACDDFSFLTELAARLCNMPYACVSLVDADRVWVKAATGMQLDQLPRHDSYSSLVVLGAANLEIPDLACDPRTAHMALTVTAPFMRYYSGVALVSSDGFAIGTLCVLDTKPGCLDDAQRATLVGLARQVMALIELRASEKTLSATARELEQLATTDELTGLHNRRSLLHRLRFEIARARRFRVPVSAVMVDLDYFKRINDDFGHADGDRVLAAVGRLVREHVRAVDIAGRYGGEELCLILPNTSLEGALHFAESLRLRIAAQTHEIGSGTLTITASLGVGTVDHFDAADAESLLRQADAALYRAKRGGRNRVEGPATERHP